MRLYLLLLFLSQSLAIEFNDQQRRNQSHISAGSFFAGLEILNDLTLFRRQSCRSSEVSCGNGWCMPADGVCCGADGYYCDAGEFCIGEQYCCTPGDVRCGAGCMPPGSVCCSDEADYCDAGETCFVSSSGTKKCCPAGESCSVSRSSPLQSF